jgi:putative glutamine amidotransferase
LKTGWRDASATFAGVPRPLIAMPGRVTENVTGARTPTVAAGARYASAIENAGGQPVVIPPFALTADLRARARDALADCDGLVLLGGADIDPARYGEPVHAETRLASPQQDTFEIAMLDAALALELPVLAICRGMQVLNVARGGTLVQHLPDHSHTINHRLVYHEVALEHGRVASAIGALTTTGHSAHHQAVNALGRGLQITGRASDGTIEAIELDAGWVVGVQWHPEDSAAEDAQQQALFDALVKQAQAH